MLQVVRKSTSVSYRLPSARLPMATPSWCAAGNPATSWVLGLNTVSGPAIGNMQSAITVTGGTNVVGSGREAIGGAQGVCITESGARILGTISAGLQVVSSQVPASTAITWSRQMVIR